MRVRIELAHPERPDGAIDVEEALIDTGATWTTVPRTLANKLGLRVIGRMAVKTAAGPQTFDQSYGYIELADKRMVAPMLISDTVEGVLIGVTTLEAMGLAVDPASGQLKESEVFLLAVGRSGLNAVRPMGTLQEDIAYVRDRIVQAYRPEKIILFGSAASDRPREDSDLDLLIIKRTRKPYFDRVLEVIRAIHIWRSTDIFVLTPEEVERGIRDNRYFLVEEILKHGKIIYERPKAPDRRSRVA